MATRRSPSWSNVKAARSKGDGNVNWEAHRQVWDHSKAKGTALLVLAAIADYADESGKAWPSIVKLAEKVRLSERETRKIVAKLEKSGELCVVHSNGGRNRRNAYHINIVNPVAKNTVSQDSVKSKTLSRRTLNPVAGDTQTLSPVTGALKYSEKFKRSEQDAATADFGRPPRVVRSLFAEELERLAEEQRQRKARAQL